MTMFVLGAYCMGVIGTFIFVMFCVGLGGRESDLWKPFVYALLWPIMLPVFLKWGD